MAPNPPDKSSLELTNNSSTERLSFRQRLFANRRGKSGKKARKDESGEKASTSQEGISQENVSSESDTSRAVDAKQTEHEDPSTANTLTPKPANQPTPSSTDSQTESLPNSKTKESSKDQLPLATPAKRSYSGRIRSRRSNRTSTSDGATSQSTAVAKPPTPTKSANPTKPSFITRVVYKVVPCVGTTREPPEIDGSGSNALERPSGELQDSKRAKEADKERPPSAPVPEPPKDETSPPQNILPSSEIAPEVILTPPPAEPDSEAKAEVVTSAAVQPPGSTGGTIARSITQGTEDSNGTSFADDEPMDTEDEEERLIKNGGAGIPTGPDGQPRPLLPAIKPEHAGRKCLVLDLDETLVHSSFKAVAQADFIVPVEIEYHWHHFHVLKRPGVDDFLKKMGEIYEVVIYTASLSKYADPVLDKLDLHHSVTHRLFRESCYSHKGNYVKDLSQLGRPISEVIILDNSPASYIFNPTNAVPVSSWFNDPHDTELSDLVPFLTDLKEADDFRGILDGAILSSSSPSKK